MKCADHPHRDAVAVLHSMKYDSYFGACDSCYKEHKKATEKIQQFALEKALKRNQRGTI